MDDSSTPAGGDHHSPSAVTELMQERKMNKHKKRKNEKRGSLKFWERFSFQLSLSVLAVVIALVAVTVFGVFVWQHNQRKLHANGTDTDGPCLQCSLLTEKSNILSLSHPLLQALSKKTVDGVLMCCAKSSEAMYALLQLIMWSRANPAEALETFYPGNFSFSKASVHKRLLPSNFQPELEVPKFLANENVSLIFDPSEVDPLTEHVREVELMPTVAIIRHPGLYYVYSSVLFKPDSARPCKYYERQTWDHNIVLTRNNDKLNSGIIFRSAHTCCDECIRHKATSFTGGTLHLQQNDEIHIEVSGYSLVSFRKEGSFFGLMMLGNEEN